MAKTNKRGSLEDMAYVIAVLLFFSILVIVSFKIYDSFNDEIQITSNTTMDTLSKVNSQRIHSLFPGIIDNSFLIFTIGMCMAALILATLVRIHPVFFVFRNGQGKRAPMPYYFFGNR